MFLYDLSTRCIFFYSVFYIFNNKLKVINFQIPIKSYFCMNVMLQCNTLYCSLYILLVFMLFNKVVRCIEVNVGFCDVWPAAPDLAACSALSEHRAARLLTSSATQAKPTSSLTAQPTNWPTVTSPTTQTITYRRWLRVNSGNVWKAKTYTFCGYNLHERWERIVLMSVNFSWGNTPTVTSAARSQRVREAAVTLRVARYDGVTIRGSTWTVVIEMQHSQFHLK